MTIVEDRVKPERSRQKDRGALEKWWQFIRPRPELRAAIAGLRERVLVIARVGQHVSFAFLPTRTVYSDQLIVFSLSTYAAFCGLQSRLHEIWARFFSSSMKDDLRYTPTDCFENFPFPEDWHVNPVLEAAGRSYYEYRAQLMVDNDQGITRTYNRFHDIYETDPRIMRLRELHAELDQAVLGAYGWSDICPDCNFLLDYEIDETIWGSKKKPYRYRLPDTVQNEVLDRLLTLNAERAAAEARRLVRRS